MTSTYQEILLSLPPGITPTVTPTTEGYDPFTSTLSLPNHMVTFIVRGSMLTIQTMSTTASTDSSKTTSMTLNDFTSPILNSVTSVALSPTEYLLIVFTEGCVVRFYKVDVNEGVNTSKKPLYASFTLNSKPTCVDLIEKKPFYKFIIGTENGSLLTLEIFGNKDTESNELNCRLNLINTNSGSILHSLLSLSSLSSLTLTDKGDSKNKGVTALKYIGNDIVAVIRGNMCVDIINIVSHQLLKSEELSPNSYKQLKSAKICYKVLDLAKRNNDIAQEKIFSLYISMNFYNQKSEIYSLELWFLNIKKQTKNIVAETFEEYYSKIDIGNDLRIKNIRNYCYDGQIVDMVLFQSRLWVITTDKKNVFNTKVKSIVIDSNSESEAQIENSFKIFTSQNQTSLITIEEKYQNVLNIIAQVRKNPNLTPFTLNKILYSIISNSEEYFLTETLIAYINRQFKTMFINKRQILNFISKNYLIESSDKFIDNDIIIPLIYEQVASNAMLGIGFFDNNDIETIAIFRENGISLLKKVELFERVDVLISYYEITMRRLLFEISSNEENLYPEKKVNSFITKEISFNTNNVALIAMGLIRIYLSEVFLLLNDEKYIKDFINEINPSSSNISQMFIDKVITENVTSQFNYLSSLDFIHQILYDLFTNYKDKIICSIGLFQAEFKSIISSKAKAYFDPLMDGRDENEKNAIFTKNTFIVINSKYCDIISKLVNKKTASIFRILRDSLSLLQWKDSYSNMIDVDVSFEEEQREDTIFSISKQMFIQILSCYIVSNHLTYFNMENVTKIDKASLDENMKYKDKEVTYLEFLIFDQFSENGSIIIKLLKNEFINYIINILIWDVLYLGNTDYEIYKLMSRNNDDELIYIVNTLQNMNDERKKINFVYISILAMGKMEQIDKMKNLIDIFYSLLNKDTLVDFEMFYKGLKFESIFQYENLINPIMKGFLYLEKMLSRVLKPNYLNEFYKFSFEYLYPVLKSAEAYAEIESNNNILKTSFAAYISSLFDSCLKLNPDLALSLLSNLKNLYTKKNISLLSISKDKIIDKFINYLQINTVIYKKTPLISKLILYQYEFLIEICEEIERTKLNIKNSESISTIGSGTNSFNFFKLLIYIYLQMKEYSRTAMICVQYAKAIDMSIMTDQLRLSEMIQLYKEEISALNDALMALKRCKGNICYINPFDVISSKKICELKLMILLIYMENDKLQRTIDEDNICLIKQNSQMLNMIFKIRLYDIAIQIEIIKYLKFKDGKTFIFNMVKNLIKDNSFDLLEMFIKQIINGDICNEYEFILLDNILSNDSDFKVGDICNELSKKNVIRVIEILLKYEKFEYIIDMLDLVVETNREVPLYLVDNINKTANMYTGSFGGFDRMNKGKNNKNKDIAVKLQERIKQIKQIINK